MRPALAAFACALVLSACASTAPATNDADAYIRASAPRFAEAFNNGDWARVAAFYTDDAVIMSPNLDIARGPAGAREVYSVLANLDPSMTILPERVIQSCDLAFEYGRYEMRLTPPGAATIHDRGKYAAVWRRMPNGEWKITGDIFNTSLPAPGM